MGKSYADSVNPGLFVPTTDILDAQAIYKIDINSKEFKEFLVKMRNSINQMSLSLNAKDSGYYSSEEFVTGQSWAPSTTSAVGTSASNTQRMTYRKIYNCGALLAPGLLLSTPLGITTNPNTRFTKIYGCATRLVAGNYNASVPLPYITSGGAGSVSLYVDFNNVQIITTGTWEGGDAWTGFTDTVVVLEYLQN